MKRKTSSVPATQFNHSQWVLHTKNCTTVQTFPSLNSTNIIRNILLPRE
jgi:hypothetical protein